MLTEDASPSAATDARTNAVRGGAPVARWIPIDSVRVPARRLRAVADVDALRESIASAGLLQPIVVDESLMLLCGAHRLAACRALGWTEVPAVVTAAEGPRARLAEIDENLCRRELSALERAEHLALRRKLWEEIGPPPSAAVAGEKKRPRRAPEEALEAFLADTERRTGRGKALIKQELKIGELPEEVRDLARETPVSHSKKELLALTRMAEPEQVAALEAVRAGDARSVRKRGPKAPKPAAPAATAPVATDPSVPPWEDALPTPGASADAANEPAPVLFSDPEPAAPEVPAGDPWEDHWSAVAASLGRVVYELEQAVAAWPDDPSVVSDEDGDEGRHRLRRLLDEVRPVARVVRARLAAGPVADAAE